MFDGDGSELVKLRGLHPAGADGVAAAGVVDDPTPGPSVRRRRRRSPPPRTALTAELRTELEALLVEALRPERGGWGFVHKYLDSDASSTASPAPGRRRRARADGARDADAQREADRSGLGRRLPVLGRRRLGPSALREDHVVPGREPAHLLPLAYAQCARTRGPAGRARHPALPARVPAARPRAPSTRARTRTSSQGEHSAEYFALDDAERRSAACRASTGTSTRARTAGRFRPSCALYAATGEDGALAEARRRRAGSSRIARCPGGGFRHDETGRRRAVPRRHAGDGPAFLALYAATGDRVWLTRARRRGRLCRQAPSPPRARRASSRRCRSGRFAPAQAPARRERGGRGWANLLFRYTGEESDRRLADRAMEFLVVPDVARRFSTASVLLADAERSSEPPHLTVVGRRDDALTRVLLAAAVSDPGAYKRVELLDRREGALPNLDVGAPGARIRRGLRLRQRPMFPAGLYPRRAAQENDPASRLRRPETIESDPHWRRIQ